MKNSDFAYCYHPVTVMFIDDNKGFLDSIELELGDKIRMIMYTDPCKAVENFSSEENIAERVLKLSNNYGVDKIDEFAVDVSIGNLHKIIYDHERFNYTAIAVVDYDMPLMNGIELCKAISGKKVFKILLTANADKETAIRAFNAGLIDMFLFKNSTRIHEEIIGAINKLKARYFVELSNPLMTNFGRGLNKLFSTNIYKELFDKTLKESKAAEYYLIDRSGSFLFLDEFGNATWLVIRNNQDFEEHILMLEGLDASDHIVNPLKSREKLLFLLTEEEYKKDVSQWHSHMFEAKSLGNEFYAIVNGNISNAIDWDKIKAYSKF